jgi:FkbM family methyltransferase
MPFQEIEVGIVFLTACHHRKAVKRQLKQSLKPFIPSSLRTFLKSRLMGRDLETANSHIRFVERTEGIECVIDEAWSFKMPLSFERVPGWIMDSPETSMEFYGIARAARQGGVLFDVGASIGHISALFCAANPDNRVIAFEPSPLVADKLAALRQINQFGDRMKIEQSGIGDVTAVRELFIYPDNGFVQVEDFDPATTGTPGIVSCQIETLADAAMRLAVVPTHIKLDVEGFEYEVVKGSMEFLSKHQPILFFELHLDYLEKKGVPPKVVTKMLEECGYSFRAYSGKPLKAAAINDALVRTVRFIACRA